MSTLALLPNLFGPDGLIIFVVLMLFFGAKRLPELARGMGSAIREFSKAREGLDHEPVSPASPAQQIEAPRHQS